MTHPVRGRRLRLALVASAAVAALAAEPLVAVVAPAAAGSASAAATSAPTLGLSRGQTLEGIVTVASDPTTVGDDVASLVVTDAGGQAVKTFRPADDTATRTLGTAHLSFDMGGNGTEARYRNYLVVNGQDDPAHRVYFPTIEGGESGTLDFPAAWLTTGTNTVTVHADGAPVRYGAKSEQPNVPDANWHVLPNGEGVWCKNYDDFPLSSISLATLDAVADGEANNFSYSLGDGTCGSSKSATLQADLEFVITGEPGATKGLSADFDTAAVPNGDYTVTATTESGASVSREVSVNNAPPGAAKLTPMDGALVHGRQPVIAALRAGTSGTVTDLQVDDAPARNAETLAAGTATVGFTVLAGNSVEARYHNLLKVNGHQLDLGGDYGVAGDEPVQVEVPQRYLHLGDNVVEVVTGDYNGTSGGKTCANRDDFKIGAASLALEQGTVTPGDSFVVTSAGKTPTTGTFSLGDGTCATNKDAEFHFTVTGAPTPRTVDTLGSGEAHLRVRVGGNGTDTGYDNVVLVNGIPLDLGIWEEEDADLVFPNEWLVPGTNVIDFVAGSDHKSRTGGCDNYDDFTLKQFALQPADGVAALRTKQVAESTVAIGSASYPTGSEITVYLGDGSCGSSFNAAYRHTVVFDVRAEGGSPLPALGLRADLDTTEVADGRHALSARVGDKTATRHFSVDNSAPVVAESVPTDGQRLTSTVALDVQLEDASGVAGTPAITLDGKPVKQGDQIGHGLAAGDHEIKVTAGDSLGNSATRTIRFSSATIPDVPADLDAESTDPSSATLSATVPGAEGAQLTATFSRTDVVLPTSGYQGRSAEVPTTLDPAQEKGVTIKALQPGDGRTVDTASGGDVVFQRYDVKIGTPATTPVLRWEGVIDPARTVALRAWNTDKQEWVPLTSARGAVQGNTVLTAPVRPAFVDGGTVHVLVTGEDPFADDLSPRDASAQDDKDHLEDPKDYDFALAHFTDTQYLTEGAAGGTYNDWDGVDEASDVESPEEQAIWQAAYRKTTEWIAANHRSRKIAYTAHTGDVIENDYYDPLAKDLQGNLLRPGLHEQVERELAVSSGFQGILDDAGVVNQVIAGNHDDQLGAETGPTSRFSRTFSTDRYYAASQKWPTGDEYHAWDEVQNPDGSVTEGRDNQNNYVLFSAGGLDFVAVGLSYGVTKQEAAWADGIFKRYHDRNGILLSHDYLKPSTAKDARGATFSAPDGSMLYKQVVADNPNVFLVLAGHEHGVGTNIKTRIGATVAHNVVELLADYQFYTVSAGELGLDKVLGADGQPIHQAGDRLQFGASFLRLLQFNVARGEMSVDTYSPLLDNYGATEFDIRADGSQKTPRYNGSEDNMVLPVDLSSRVTSFSSDSLAVYVPTGEIGAQTVTAGGTASVTWTGLKPGTSYGWMVTASSPDGGTAVAQPSVFRTGKVAATVTAEPVTAAYGAAAEVVVRVGGAENADGTVTLTEGGKTLGSAEVVDGTATVKVAAGLRPGRHDLAIAYAGGDALEPAQGSTTLTVERGTALVTATAAAVTAGRAGAVRVTVDGAGLPVVGTVTVREGSRVLGSATLESGRAEVALPVLTVGAHTLTVDYSGSDALPPASTTTALRVDAAAKARSTVSASAAPRTVKRGKAFVVRTVVRAGRVAATGRVAVFVRGRQVGTATLDRTGRAAIRVRRALAPGRHTVTVRYLGSGTVLPATGTTTVRVVKPRRR